ncbi:Threonine efflux protein [bioreactor metagenome]|uniref:Threonine efflux protein n=1 Tax=bioreactor metagenome TaxID=1076179 RepID=A0A644U802_9ZZZZ|nr:LysE family transporter [Negativicutes bacterium]
MENIFLLMGILLTVLIGAISPGPSFLFVARTSISESRRNGIAAAIGISVGSFIFTLLVLLGLKTIFANLPWLYMGLKIIGGIYLVYLGITIWRGANESISVETMHCEEQNNYWRSFGMALFTQMSNPKTAVFYGSIITALLPQTVSVMFMVLLPLCVLLIEIGWFSVVALVLSSNGPRSTYFRSKIWIDRVAGGVMGLLGIKLSVSADIIN